LPPGTALAILLYRTDLPGRQWLRFALLLELFVPLPLITCGWQGASAILPETGRWAPWRTGFGIAVWLHAAAALPWVVVVVGQGLLAVEPELEEEAATMAGPWRVLARVSLSRARAALGAAGLWVAVLVAGEITITDLMQIRTFAEEVYSQFVAPEPTDTTGGDPVARALAAALPWAAALAGIVLLTARRWERDLPAGDLAGVPRPFALGRWRWPAAAASGIVALVLVGVPVFGLVWRAGEQRGGAWSFAELLVQLTRAARSDRGVLLSSLASAAEAGLLTGTLALLLCWAVRGTRFFLSLVLAILALALALPGPVLGVGLKEVIHRLLDLAGWDWLGSVLYYGPSPLPLVWVDLVRFLPLAMALLWPVVRLVPPELMEAARVDGARPWQEFLHVTWPLSRAAWGRACLAAGILSLGELSAGKLVATPGCPGYAQELFARMHYGVTPDLAAGCLLLLAIVTLLAGGVFIQPAAAGARPRPPACERSAGRG
jgi:iron(III) transport system permease protein